MISDKDVVQALSTIAEYCSARQEGFRDKKKNMCDDCPIDKIIPGGDCADIFSCSPYHNTEDVKDFLEAMPDNTGTTKNSTNDAVDHPAHYCQGGIETIAILKAKMPAERFIGFLEGNVIKYLTRAPYKGNEVQDLEKADWYLKRLVEEYKGAKKTYLEGMQKP